MLREKLLMAVSVSPTIAFPFPALVDYPNHLARMYILSRAVGNPHPYYEVVWRPFPNVALDVLVPPLASLMGVPLATRAFLLVSQVGLFAGATLLERSVK